MRVLTLPFLTILIISMVGVSWSQQLSNFYTPYGFRFPYLDKGEYSISFGTNYYEYIYKYDYPDSGLDRTSMNKNTALTLSALYGISKSLLFRGSMSFFPSLTSSEYDSYTVDPLSGQLYFYKNKSNTHSYISPSATLVFRPGSTIELFADYSTYVYNIDQFYITESETTLQYKIRRQYHYIWVGVNIIGKL
ncbi:MAG: hypothetical protein JSW64_14500 [Candidatus Zixiibacteriota bacterium]|nr:MAG: hypothetical protein JSW64_14500 [candidate division Zixibacteria bacterium]